MKNIESFRCEHCGSDNLKKVKGNEYLCEHCDSRYIATQIKDNENDKLYIKLSKIEKKKLKLKAVFLISIFSFIMISILISSIIIIGEINKFKPIVPVNNYTIGYNYSEGHKGVDLLTDTSVPVFAVEDGVVKDVLNNGMGQCLVVAHKDQFIVRYYSIERLQVTKGDKIKKNQIIAYTSTSKFESELGYHLHFMLSDKNDQYINPNNYIKF